MFRTSAPTLHRFFRWWFRELGWFVPGPLRDLFAGRAERYLLELGPTEATVHRLQGNRKRVVTTLPRGQVGRASRNSRAKRLRGAEIFVRVPPNEILRKTISVPAAAQRNLRSVVNFQIDKQTPFSLEEVRFGYGVPQPTADNAQLRLSLFLVPRQQLEAAAVAVAGFKAHLAGMCTKDEGGGPAQLFEFQDDARTTIPSRHRAIAQVGLCAVTAVLIAIAIYLPFENQRQELALIESELTVLRNRANMAITLDKELASLIDRRAYVARKKTDAVSLTRAVRDLSARIPDGVWITQLTSRGLEFRLHGYAPSAPQLVADLEATAEFQNVALVSKVSRDEVAKLDDFQLLLEATARP